MTNPIQVIIDDIRAHGFWWTTRILGGHLLTGAAGYFLQWGISTGWRF